MIQINELRIGNLIQDDVLDVVKVVDIFSHGQVVVESKTDKGYKNFVFNISGIKPIPLTKEWLLKFGKAESNLNLSFIIGEFKVWVDKSNNEYDWYFVWDKQHIKIKHVHQLQNLYFALTGQELTIKN